jgi:hypothetical protein
MQLGEQLRFCLEGFVNEEAEQLQFVRALATHDFGKLIFRGHLKKTIKI